MQPDVRGVTLGLDCTASSCSQTLDLAPSAQTLKGKGGN